MIVSWVISTHFRGPFFLKHQQLTGIIVEFLAQLTTSGCSLPLGFENQLIEVFHYNHFTLNVERSLPRSTI